MSHISQRYVIYSGDQHVLDVQDGSGVLVSVSAPPPPPGQPPITHPFLSASFYAPEHEGRIANALWNSSSTHEFLDTLRAQGYRVEEATDDQ